jgi:hypothetical protein
VHNITTVGDFDRLSVCLEIHECFIRLSHWR